MCTCVQWSVSGTLRSGLILTRPAPGYEYQSPRVPICYLQFLIFSPHSKHRQHLAGVTRTRVMLQLFITEYPLTVCLLAVAAATHGVSDPNNLAQPWPKCCLLTVIVERKWIDGIWSGAQGFLAMEGGEDVGNCSRCIFYRLKIAELRLLVQVISGIWGPCAVDTRSKPLGTQLDFFRPFLHFSQ